MLLKKGAMFGLDARIALAIFGALSVISGAALYSAIESSKATATLTELLEVGKAWEQYYLDTGEQVRFGPGNSSNESYHKVRMQDFITDPGIAGWKGPYLSQEFRTVDAADLSLIHPTFDFIYMFAFDNGSSWGADTSIGPAFCTAGEDCYIWAYFSGTDIVAESMHNAIDQKVDNGDGSKAGRFRWTSNGGNAILQIAKIKNRAD
jgi:hypothetical protein